MNTDIIIQKQNFALNIWDKPDFDEMLKRSTNTYFSKIIKTYPLTSHPNNQNTINIKETQTQKKQSKTLAIIKKFLNINKTNNNLNKNNKPIQMKIL